MIIRLLGPVELQVSGQVIQFGPPKRRAVVAALAADAGRPVPVRTLVDRVWDETPPAEARNALYAHILHIRRVLAAAAQAGGSTVQVTRSAGGYLLQVDRDAVDLHRFRRLVEQARQSRPSDDQRVALLRAALELWRDTPLAGLPGSWTARFREGCRQQRLDAVLALAQAELRLGDRESVITRLTGMLPDHPTVEPLTAMLMRALHGAGRTPEALELYLETRQRLVDGMGVEPGPELQGLYKALLRGEPVQPPTRSPVPPGPAAGAARLPVPAQLPGAVAGFTGRRDALKTLHELLPADDQSGAVTIAVVTGTAGVGKTALVVHWAHQAADRFPDGQLYLNLRGYDATAPMPAAVALESLLRALGHEPAAMPQPLDERAALYRSALAGRRMLVLLDNARDADQVRPLLPGSARCVALVTSRDDLPGLVARDGAHRVTLDRLSDSEAVELLGRILGGERTGPEPAAVVEMVRLCGGLPLALRVAAERAARRSRVALAELVDELAGPANRLDAFEVPSDPASAVRNVFSWSYRALPGEAARLFRLLGLHPGGDLAVPAAAALAGTGVPAAGRELELLAGAHLVEQTAPDRYQLHDLLRAYAAELAGPDEAADARLRLLDHYLATADTASQLVNPHRRRFPLEPPADRAEPVPLADADAALWWYDSEAANLVAAVEDAVTHRLYAHAWQLPGRLLDYFDLRKRWTDWIDTHRLALAATRALGHRAGEGRTRNNLGVAYLQQGRYADAVHCYLPALAICRETGDRHGECLALANLGIAYRELDRPEESLACLGEALEAFREMGNRYGEGRIRNSLGIGYAAQGRLAEAVDQYRAALAIHREVGDRRNEGTTLNNLGEAYRRMGRYAEAEQRFRQALPILDEVADEGEAGETLTRLGRALHATGDPGRARDCWAGAVAIFERLGDPRADETRRLLG